MQQQVSRKKIVWPDIEVVAMGYVEHYLYHKRERCARTIGLENLGEIIRFRTFLNGKKIEDVTACTACHVPVGNSVKQRLRKHGLMAIVTKFGPSIEHRRNRHYVKLP